MHGQTKAANLGQARRMLLMGADGISLAAVAQALGVDYSTAHRYIVDDLQARRVDKGLYTLDPTPEDVSLALAILNRAAGGQT